MDYTCRDCLYANFNEDNSVLCDRNLLASGKVFYRDAENVDKSCIVHSSKDIENWRYVENAKYLHQCDDSCSVCRRLVNLNDTTQYGYIEVQDKNGKAIGEKMQCKICRYKGRS